MTRLILFTTFFHALLCASVNSFAFDDLDNAILKEVPEFLKDAEVIELGFLNPDGNQDGMNKQFPPQEPFSYDPINKKMYQKTIVGKTFKAGFFFPYTHWRYITVYNVVSEMEPIAYLPYYEEECYDDSFRLASWGESRSLKVSLRSEVSAQVGVDGLGLGSSVSTSIEQGITFSTSRSIKATLGLKARHYPYKRSETWVGKTWIETYNSKTGELGYLLPSIVQDFFNSYPYDFELDNQNVGFVVQREVIKYCESMVKDETSSSVGNEILLY